MKYHWVWFVIKRPLPGFIVHDKILQGFIVLIS